MRKHLAKSMAAVVVASAALAGCGGGGNGLAQPEAPQPFMGTTVQSLLDYMNQLIAQTDETSEPQPVSNVPLPVDDTV